MSEVRAIDNPTPDEVRAMHDQLLRSYAAILLRSSQLPAFMVGDRWGAESRRQVGDLGPVWRRILLLSIPFDALLRLLDAIAYRFLVLPFIESHINQRLSQLDRAYLYFTHASPASIVPPSADWLVVARAQVQDLNETLKPWDQCPLAPALSRAAGRGDPGSAQRREHLRSGRERWQRGRLPTGRGCFQLGFVRGGLWSKFLSLQAIAVFFLQTPETIGTAPGERITEPRYFFGPHWVSGEDQSRQSTKSCTRLSASLSP